MTLELHAWPTPNAFKVSIMLEECGLDFTAKPVNIGQGDQHTAEFRRMNPNAKMPVLVDTEGPDGQPITLFESGLILQYLAEKTDRFLAQSPQTRYECLEWLTWQMAGFGPMLGQAHHFRIYAPERVEYAYDRKPAFLTAPMSAARITASPTWPSIPGQRCMRNRASIWPTSPTSGNGWILLPGARAFRKVWNSWPNTARTPTKCRRTNAPGFSVRRPAVRWRLKNPAFCGNLATHGYPLMTASHYCAVASSTVSPPSRPWARAASRNSSISPSRTLWDWEVSSPVRKSLTS